MKPFFTVYADDAFTQVDYHATEDAAIAFGENVLQQDSQVKEVKFGRLTGVLRPERRIRRHGIDALTVVAEKVPEVVDIF